MIQTEILNNSTLIRHYSDQGFKILQLETGILYEEAIDILPCEYHYKETNIKSEIYDPITLQEFEE